MPKLRLLCTAIFAVAAILHYCAADVVLIQADIPIFPVKQDGDINTSDLKEKLEQSDTTAKTSLSIATTVMDNYVTIKDIAKKTIGKGLKYLPVVGQIAGVVLDLLSIFEEPPNPLGELVKYVDAAITKETQKTTIATIEIAMGSVMDSLDWLNKWSKDETKKHKFDGHMFNLKDKVYTIVSYLMKEEFHLREHPAVAVPKLFAMAPIAATVSEYLQRENETEDISCLYAAAIKQYFHPFLYDRLRKIKVSGGVQYPLKHEPVLANRYEAAILAEFMKPFLYKGVEEYNGFIEDCELLKDGQKLNRFHIIVNDTTAPPLLCKDFGLKYYLLFIRNIIEKQFSDMYEIVDGTCLQPKKPSGE